MWTGAQRRRRFGLARGGRRLSCCLISMLMPSRRRSASCPGDGFELSSAVTLTIPSRFRRAAFCVVLGFSTLISLADSKTIHLRNETITNPAKAKAADKAKVRPQQNGLFLIQF